MISAKLTKVSLNVIVFQVEKIAEFKCLCQTTIKVKILKNPALFGGGRCDCNAKQRDQPKVCPSEMLATNSSLR